jgi:hypothetical protein
MRPELAMIMAAPGMPQPDVLTYLDITDLRGRRSIAAARSHVIADHVPPTAKGADQQRNPDYGSGKLHKFLALG